MTAWTAVLLASIACVLLKTLGYLVPPSLLSAPRPARIAELLTVALLGALVAVQTFASGQELVVDARIPALFAAGILLWLRAPFVVVVIAAASVAAVLRAIGLAA
ncbi:hypothetical protein FHX49_000330 [Microbacterium endophyticum]|uniref:Branched-chain amino acid transporter AzlD n=1 Tax=Microbacterium endophyticum TaxID=1526412 RepID=A0A7W4V114_9MICO|nr:AzlD domain-containing protein [Microbacterium endophyticum]MBB2974789.1 hypothetical protein [Microbacterium endophyticum]NIK37086.1 hypothetical protein [Microbacterium endophyticum]